uniref:Uncharacterized protein n=1 Tax=Mycena chlorophos TaxID=658473 RepID=A0ABQ0KZE8_MYCCL|nr:predicted protein [Mycena chlorophos]
MAYAQYYSYPQQNIYAPPVASSSYTPAYPSTYPSLYSANAAYTPAAYNAPAPAPQPFIPPNVMAETSAEKPRPSEQPKNPPKRSHRAATTPLPLKSALKKPGGATPGPSAAVPLAAEDTAEHSRKRSKSRRDKVAAQTPPDPVPEAESYHMFVTFKGDSELLLENTLDNARKEIEDEVLKLWRHGLESSQFRASNWTIRFKNAPWNMAGPDVAHAWEVVVALFTLFARRGFYFVASTKCTTTQPRLVFQATSPDPKVHFFLAFMSRSGRRATLINPPPHIMAEFGTRLQASMEHVDVSHDEDLILAELKRDIGGTPVKPSFFLMKVLKTIVDLGYNLNATVPMARGGPLGMGSRRELLVFKGIIGK